MSTEKKSTAGAQQIYEAYEGMYRFRYLPGLATFIREHHVAAFAQYQYDYSVRMQLPLLQHFAQLPEAELAALGQKATRELLEALAEDKAAAFIRASVDRWTANELPLMRYFDVMVEDVTVLNHVRAEAFRHFIPDYTNDVRTALELASEVDRLFMGFTTSSMVIFIDLLRARISRRETQLLEAEALAHVGSFDWDLVHDTTESSPEMRAIIGTDAPMPLADFLEYVHPDDSELLRGAVAQAFVSGSLQCEFRFNSQYGPRILWARGVVHHEQGRPVRMLGVIQDLTERKRMEEVLLLKTLELERSNEELQQFASVASHDLNEPLRKIVLYSGLLETETGAQWSEAGRRNLERIKDAARRMRMLIEDILAFSSLNQEQEPQAVPLEGLLQEVCEVLESRIRETGALVTSDGLPEAVVVPFQMRQLFQNLLSNSLKFIRAGTPPEIKVRHRFLDAAPGRGGTAARTLEIEFSDNGIGFAPQYAEKIFGLFNRLHSRNQFEGTGLGLAICRKVVENHGGRIEAISGGNAGASFRIQLPQ